MAVEIYTLTYVALFSGLGMKYMFNKIKNVVNSCLGDLLFRFVWLCRGIDGLIFCELNIDLLRLTFNLIISLAAYVIGFILFGNVFNKG